MYTNFLNTIVKPNRSTIWKVLVIGGSVIFLHGCQIKNNNLSDCETSFSSELPNSEHVESDIENPESAKDVYQLSNFLLKNYIKEMQDSIAILEAISKLNNPNLKWWHRDRWNFSKWNWKEGTMVIAGTVAVGSLVWLSQSWLSSLWNWLPWNHIDEIEKNNQDEGNDYALVLSLLAKLNQMLENFISNVAWIKYKFSNQEKKDIISMHKAWEQLIDNLAKHNEQNDVRKRLLLDKLDPIYANLENLRICICYTKR